MDPMNFVDPKLLILVPVLYFIGLALKKSEMKDKYIPLVLGAVGIILAVIWVLSTMTVGTLHEGLLAVFTGITQGVLVAGLSVYGNQLIKQAGKDS